jgi:hypothetical protein
VEKAEDMESATCRSKKARAEGTEADGSIGVVPRLYRAGQLTANRKLWKSRIFFDLGRIAQLATLPVAEFASIREIGTVASVGQDPQIQPVLRWSMRETAVKFFAAYPCTCIFPI